MGEPGVIDIKNKAYKLVSHSWVYFLCLAVFLVSPYTAYSFGINLVIALIHLVVGYMKKDSNLISKGGRLLLIFSVLLPVCGWVLFLLMLIIFG